MYYIISCAIFCAYTLSLCSDSVHGSMEKRPYIRDTDQPLILTPLINAGKIREAREASKVTGNIFLGIESYSGYLTVNEAHNSNLFFWFFPAAINYTEAPVILWLQGGPGDTSMIGLFVEHGPFYVTSNLDLAVRKYPWTENHSVIYIDSPVGTGYSFTDADGHCQNETVIGTHLYSALLQFFQLFPELQSNSFFVAGESYAGKYVPAISYTIHKNNPTAKQKIQLKGLAIGNGLCDPEHQLQHSEYLYQIGLIDTNTRQKLLEIEEEGVKLIRNKEWIQAFQIFDSIINGDLNNHTSMFKNVTGFDNYFNYLIVKYTDIQYYEQFIQQENVRALIHVGNSTFNPESVPVKINLLEDIMQSVAPWISELLSNYRVLIYNGQLDIILAYPLTVNYLKNLKFSASEEYRTAARKLWYVDEDLAGYVKSAGNLTEVLVRNAGHMVPFDQSRWALDLITHLTYNKKFV